MTCKFHGGPLSECEDDDKDWFPQLTICRPTATREAARALYAKLHEELPFTDGNGNWSKERSWDNPYHFLDGATIWLSDVDTGGPDFWLPSRREEPVREPK